MMASPLDTLNEFLDNIDFEEGSGKPRDQRWDVRLTKGELTALQMRAAMFRLSPAEYFRQLCCQDPRKRIDPMLTTSDWKLAGDYVAYRMEANRLRNEVFRLRQDVTRVGTNVNQIAKSANRHDALAHTRILEMRKSMDRLTQELKTIESQCERLLASYESLSKFEEMQ